MYKKMANNVQTIDEKMAPINTSLFPFSRKKKYPGIKIPIIAIMETKTNIIIIESV